MFIFFFLFLGERIHRERYREIQRDTERYRQTQTNTDKHIQRDTERYRENTEIYREIQREYTYRQTHTHTYKHGQTHTDTETRSVQRLYRNSQILSRTIGSKLSARKRIDHVPALVPATGRDILFLAPFGSSEELAPMHRY
jgi:hypothetical protein